MKVKFEELKIAIDWIHANTKDYTVSINMLSNYVEMKCFDNMDREVIITIYDEKTSMSTRITKTETLK